MADDANDTHLFFSSFSGGGGDNDKVAWDVVEGCGDRCRRGVEGMAAKGSSVQHGEVLSPLFWPGRLAPFPAPISPRPQSTKTVRNRQFSPTCPQKLNPTPSSICTSAGHVGLGTIIKRSKEDKKGCKTDASSPKESKISRRARDERNRVRTPASG